MQQGTVVAVRYQACLILRLNQKKLPLREVLEVFCLLDFCIADIPFFPFPQIAAFLYVVVN